MTADVNDQLSFTWIRRDGPGYKLSGKGGVITGDSTKFPKPGLIDLIPKGIFKNITTTHKSKTRASNANYGNSLHHPYSKIQTENFGTSNEKYKDKRKTFESKDEFSTVLFSSNSDSENMKVLDGKPDLEKSMKSTLHLKVTEPMTVVCYARNQEGISRVPCVYSISVIGKSLAVTVY